MTTSPTASMLPPASRTAKGSATSMTRSPTSDSTWPANSSRNCASVRSTSGTSAPILPIAREPMGRPAMEIAWLQLAVAVGE